MATVTLLTDDPLAPEAAAVFADIRAARGTNCINNVWRALALDPALLAGTRAQLKAVMGAGRLSPQVKEMIYLAVSIAHGCDCCIDSHTAAARAKGMGEAGLMGLMAIVGMAAPTNRRVAGLGVPVDEVFKR